MSSDHQAIVATFLAECEENLSAIEETLVRLEGRRADPELLDAIFRAAHTLKGNAASFGLAAAARVAHVMEEVLERLRGGRLEADASLVTVLLRAVDVLRRRLPVDLSTGDGESDSAFASVLGQLERFAASIPAGEVETRDGAPAPFAPSPSGVLREETAATRHAGGTDVRVRTLRVGIEKLDRLLNLAGELAISRGRLRQALEEGASPELRHALEIHSEADRIHSDLQELVMEARMVSVGPVFRHHVRTLRDQAAALGKRARLVLEGEDVEADTKIVDYMRDPLTHMIRNAIDHGIEDPSVREAAGKDPCGTITLRARHETGNVVVEVSDDGAGLDLAAIRERGRQRALIGDDESPSDDRLRALVLEPGFSTTERATAMSGRGVGLDVVRRHVEALRGTISLESRSGRGTTVRMSVPLTVAVVPGFSVGVTGETYIIPLEWVVETLELPPGPRAGRPREVVELRGEALPCVSLRSLFRLSEGERDRAYVVVVSHDGERVGLAVDVLHGECQAVIKPLGRALHGTPGLAGSAILGDGRVALILDVPAILNEATRNSSSEATCEAQRRY